MPIQCDDDNPCTIDTCNQELNGTCSYVPLECDDENPCTTDSCNVETGQCEHTAIPTTSLSFTSTLENAAGVALWNSDGSGDEPAAQGHALEVCEGLVTPYYLASADYAGISLTAPGAGRGAASTGLDAFNAHLATMGMNLDDLRLKIGLSDMGADEEGVDWSFDEASLVEQRLYQGVTVEIWLGDKPLCKSTLGTVTTESEYSACDPLPRPMSIESDWAYAVDLTSGANVNVETQLAAQLLLQALGIPAEVKLELQLTMDELEPLQTNGRTGYITRGITGTIHGQECETTNE